MRRSPWPGTTAGEISNVTVQTPSSGRSGTVNACVRESGGTVVVRPAARTVEGSWYRFGSLRSPTVSAPPVQSSRRYVTVGPDHVSFGVQAGDAAERAQRLVDLVEEDAAPLVGGDDAARRA